MVDPYGLEPEQLKRQALMAQLGSASAPAVGGVKRPGQQAGAASGVATGKDGINTTMPVGPGAPLVPPAGTAPRGNNPQSTDVFRYGQGGVAPSIGTRHFDISREQNPNKSAKDAYLQAVQGAPAFQGSKEDAAAWFNQYIRPHMEGLGYQIGDVVGDTAHITSWDGSGWVDFMTNAGGENPEPWWGVQGGGGGSAPTAGGGSAGGVPTNLDSLASSDVLEQIMRQLQGLQTGDDPMQRDALMYLMGGDRRV